MRISLKTELAVFLALSGCTLLAAGQEKEIGPESLLVEALEVGGTVPTSKGYGDWRAPLLFLRIGETAQMHGLRDTASRAYEKCALLNAKGSVEAARDEIVIELCRDLTRLGKSSKARALAEKIKFRNYSLIDQYMIARTALEMDDADLAEDVIRNSRILKRPAKEKPGGKDDMWARGLVRFAVRMKNFDLARTLIGAMGGEPWRSGGLGEVAAALANEGKIEDALATAGEIPDRYMAVLGHARLAGALAGNADSLAKTLKGLNQRADEIENATARNFALLFAVRRLNSSGLIRESGQLATKVNGSCFAARALCAALTRESVGDTVNAIAACPESERNLLWETLAINAGRRGIGGAAFDAAQRIGRPWQRLRALCSAAVPLGKTRLRTEAKRLLVAGGECVGQIAKPGWRIVGRIRLAVALNDAGFPEGVAKQLLGASEELSRIEDREEHDALFPRLIEAMLLLGRKKEARVAILEALADDPSSSLRDRLLPMLVRAGEAAGALEECERQRLASSGARQLLAYRLAELGRVEEAAVHARTLYPQLKAEALVDIARALAPEPTVVPTGEKLVGVTLHGSWGSWFPRLERMGFAWELMPFFEPYEIGGEGLKAKYAALGYPGTGGHLDHTSAVGIEAIRDYIHSGGGFMGICAGQFLATRGDFVTCGTHYFRGQGPHQLQIRKDALVSLDLPPVIVVARRNGGMLIPRSGCEVIGWYDKVNRFAALIAEQSGRGRVVAFSPHPEGSSGFVPRDCLCINGLNWAITGLP